MANTFQTQRFRHIQVFFKNKPTESILSPKSFTVMNTRCIQSTTTRWKGPVKLAYTSYEGTNSHIVSPSTATPIIIQHGLLGSRKNWASLGKAIHSKTGKKVIVPDARNHGDSPHSSILDYEVLSEDLVKLMEDLQIPKAIMVGHSMGGRAMMKLALNKPSLVDKLVIVDISPVNVSPGAKLMTEFLTLMEDINLGDQLKRATARKIVDEQLQVVVKDSLLRQFLLTNLVEDNGKFRWRVNLKSIIQNLPNIIGHFPSKDEIFTGPTLFIVGEKSDYVKPADHNAIRTIFPSAEFQYITDAGHWVHAEKPAQFLEIFLKFI
ncbi:protein ABHD11-like [Daphnia carinata]|uniref:protein ABHD11-like n=1 Tax=Daphnia carinata TaxID=120202 RepID=UPI00257BC243|nr:protein ABHD11-like [Daphnia carinata]